MQALSWDKVVEYYGRQFSDDLQVAYENKGTEEKLSELSGSMRHKLRYLLDQSDAQSVLVKKYYRSGRDVAAEGAIIEALQATGYAWLASGDVQKWKQNTRYHYTRRICQSWLSLHDLFPSRYVNTPPDLVKTHEGTDTYESLGDQGWDELRGLKGTAREGRSLRIVQSEAAASFNQLEALFWFGETIRTENEIPPYADAVARATIKERLQMLQPRTKWASSSKFEMPKRLSVADPGLWRAAGLDMAVHLPANLTASVARKLLLFATGPTIHLNLEVGKIFCSETGWNRQPIFDIARDPFDLTEGYSGVITGAFFQSFKNRASHEVIGYLEGGAPPRLLGRENLRATLREVAAEFDGIDEGGFQELSQGNIALDYMERFARISEKCRHFDLAQQCDGSFFVYIRKDGSLVPTSTCSHAPARYQSNDRSGVDFPAIRRTFLFLKKREVGSFFGTAIFASQSNDATIQPHYMNDDETTEDFRRSIRLPQNAIQAIILDDKPDIALLLDINDDLLQWYIQIGKICGIRAAMLPYDSEEFVQTKKLFIRPTDNYLRTLHLIHMSLTIFRFSNKNPLRWRLQGRPLLALAIAIKLELRENGLSAALTRNSIEATASIRAGTSTLPIILTH